jgi:CheY-like chemotaxis protein
MEVGQPKSHNILVIEDDAADRLLLRRAFQQVGSQAMLHMLEDGESAWSFLKAGGGKGSVEGPDLVLLDLNLPTLDGTSLLKRIRADVSLRPMVVVVLTTSSSSEDIRSAYALGASSFITKPSSFQGLLEIARLINRYWLKLVALPPRN